MSAALDTPRMGPDTSLDIQGNSLEGLRDLLEHVITHGDTTTILDAVEVGAYLGVSSALITGYVDLLTVVDCWGTEPGYTDCDWAHPDWPSIEADCRERLKGTDTSILKLTSAEAAPLFDDDSLDLVYIDGDHAQQACGHDMDRWWPRIHCGGWLAGHDFHLPGVRAAVLSRFPEASVTTFSDTSWLVRKPQAPQPPYGIPESGTEASALSDEDVIRRFHEITYERWYPINVKWMGVPAIKSPMDLWAYQEILHEVKPTVIIETGTYNGGSALFLANMCDLLGQGHVVSIDVGCSPPAHLGTPWPVHPRLRYLQGDSASVDTLAEVLRDIQPTDTVMVILDSDHSQEHVARELLRYAPLVSVGSYLIVEDTNINGHPVLPEFGPGPAEAVDAFLDSPAGEGFEVDTGRERFLLTMNPGGYLRRTS